MKVIKIILCLCLFASFVFADWSEGKEFIDTAITSIASGATVADVADYDSNKLLASSDALAITAEFAIAAGDGSNVEFRIFGSFDNGSTWAYLTTLNVVSDLTPVTGTTVRQMFFINSHGASHVIVKSIKNGDAVNAITSVKVYLSYKI